MQTQGILIIAMSGALLLSAGTARSAEHAPGSATTPVAQAGARVGAKTAREAAEAARRAAWIYLKMAPPVRQMGMRPGSSYVSHRRVAMG